MLDRDRLLAWLRERETFIDSQEDAVVFWSGALAEVRGAVAALEAGEFDVQEVSDG